MKKIMLYLSILVVLVSCVEVKFEEPQPRGIKNLEAIPKVLQGVYVIDKKDTITISDEQIVLTKDSTGQNNEIHKLSNTFIARQWKRTLFFNMKEEEDTSWTVIFVSKNKGNKMEVGYLTYSDKEMDKVEAIKKITTAKEIKNKDGNVNQYLINPSRRELKKIMKHAIIQELGEMERIK